MGKGRYLLHFSQVYVTLFTVATMGLVSELDCLWSVMPVMGVTDLFFL